GGGQEAIGLEKWGGRPIDHPLVLTQHRGGNIRAVLLLVEPGVDAHVLEIFNDERYAIHQSGFPEAVEVHDGLEAVRVTRLLEESTRLRMVVLVVRSSLAELVHGEAPFAEAGGQAGWIEHAGAVGHGFDKVTAVEGQ